MNAFLCVLLMANSITLQPAISLQGRPSLVPELQAPVRYVARESPSTLEGLRAMLSPAEVELLAETKLKWKRGSAVRVAFSGGTTALRDSIMHAASEWTRHAHLTFDSKDRGKYREWTAEDQRHAGDIRIAFHDTDPDYQGYWSHVGRAAADSVGAGYSSMNLEGFADSLPSNWRTVVLHEFGHALALHHEQQHPQSRCEEELLWEDEPGYEQSRDANGRLTADPLHRRPGIYSVYHDRYRWSRTKVDAQLRRFAPSSAYSSAAFDSSSIMKYYFPPELMLKYGEGSCFAMEATTLSRGDRAGIGAEYPRTSTAREKARQELFSRLRSMPLQPEQRNYVRALE